KYRLKDLNDVPSTTTAAEFEKTMVLRPDVVKKTQEQKSAKMLGDTQAGMKMPAADIPPPTATVPGGGAPSATRTSPPGPAANASMGVIQILSGTSAGRDMELSKTLTTIGKPGVQVAVITRRPQGYFVTHVEGQSFPVVN